MRRLLNRTRLILLMCLWVSGSVVAKEATGLTKLSEHVYAVVDFKNASPAGNSYGANSGVIIGNDAVLVVDTRISAKKAREFIADIKKITDNPIKYVVNTHYHLDHSWGNCEFVKLGAVVIGHDNWHKLASRYKDGMSHPENYGMTCPFGKREESEFITAGSWISGAGINGRRPKQVAS